MCAFFRPGTSIGWGSEAVKDTYTAVKSVPKIRDLGPAEAHAYYLLCTEVSGLSNRAKRNWDTDRDVCSACCNRQRVQRTSLAGGAGAYCAQISV